MSRIKCPLCCQQQFDSINTLREHLLYYKYRPIICVLCSVTCNGISDLISHLETHLWIGTKYTFSDKKDGLNLINKSSIICNKNDSQIISSDNIKDKILSKKIQQLCDLQNKNRNNIESNKTVCRSSLPTNTPEVTVPGQIAEVIPKKDSSLFNLSVLPTDPKLSRNLPVSSDSLRAFTCEKCGLKIVGKDSYFDHLQNGHSENFRNGQKNVRLKNLSKSNILVGVEKESINEEVDFDVASFSVQETTTKELENISNDFIVNSTSENCANSFSSSMIGKMHPYIHKKFNHDQERQAEDIMQNYKNNYQSFLISRLNKSYNSTKNEIILRNICKTSKSIEKAVSNSIRSTEIIDKKCVKENLNDNYKCSICNKCFAKQSLRTKHQREFHVKMRFACSKCNSIFVSKRELLNHEGKHNKKLKKCTICKYSCHTSSGLRTHIFEKHSTNRKSLQCHLCKNMFKKRYSLDRHMQRSHSEKKFTCVHCDKFYHWEDDFIKHSKTHSTEMTNKCNQCNKLFKSTFTLKRHMASIHTQNSSFKCKHCCKAFVRHDSLLKHTKLHKTKF